MWQQIQPSRTPHAAARHHKRTRGWDQEVGLQNTRFDILSPARNLYFADADQTYQRGHG